MLYRTYIRGKELNAGTNLRGTEPIVHDEGPIVHVISKYVLKD